MLTCDPIAMTQRLALLVVGLVVAACGQKSVAPVETVKPLLWSVEKAGKTGHLLGTMHTGVDPDRLPKHVWDTLDAARVLAVETDLSAAAKMPVLRTDGTSLRDELGPTYWKKLEDAIGVDQASRLVGFKPLIPATIVAMHGLPATRSIDGALLDRARASGKTVVYLETLEMQFEVLGKWLDLRALKDMLDDVSLIHTTGQEMLAAYVAGDDARILAITDRERERWLARGRTAAEYDEQMLDILYRRNASWMPAIDKILSEDGGFIAVGAAHTVGPRSVVDLLRQRGYTVTRMTR